MAPPPVRPETSAAAQAAGHASPEAKSSGASEVLSPLAAQSPTPGDRARSIFARLPGKPPSSPDQPLPRIKVSSPSAPTTGGSDGVDQASSDQGQSEPRVRTAWTDEEITSIVTQFKDEGKTVGEIAKSLNRSYTAVSVKLSKMGVTSRFAPRRSASSTPSEGGEDRDLGSSSSKDHFAVSLNRKEKIRKCLSCRCDFLSEGAHNRMCDKCRGKASMGYFGIEW